MAKKKVKQGAGNSTSVSYQGNVKIQYAKGKKVYKTIYAHNSGNAELFRYIANCIAGNFNQSLMPRYIHLFNTDKGGVPDWSSINETCSSNIPFSSVQVKPDPNSTSGYMAEFTFMISYDQIKGDTNLLCLYNTAQSGDTITPLATLNADIPYVENSNLIITWQLVVSNAAY